MAARNSTQARRRGGQFTRNTFENTFGLSVEVCRNEACRALLPRPAFSTRPRRCDRCQTPVLPACPEHGEAMCDAHCASRPCGSCGQAGPKPHTINPCNFCPGCGREKPSAP